MSLREEGRKTAKGKTETTQKYAGVSKEKGRWVCGQKTRTENRKVRV
jgi:ribosomal protein S13